MGADEEGVYVILAILAVLTAVEVEIGAKADMYGADERRFNGSLETICLK